MRGLIWTTPARQDLRDIDTYLGAHSGQAAVKVLTAIRAKAMLLERFPKAGPVLDEGTRVATVVGTSYAILYRETVGGVEILRIRHAREDWRPE